MAAVVAASAAAPPPLSLHDLLRSTGPVDWRSVLTRTSSHPHEACTRRGGLLHRGRARYPLQLALSRFRDPPAPLDVVQTLIEAHPRAVFTRDDIGTTPLYYATIHAPHEVVQMLLDANPAAASQPEKYYKKLPIHVAHEKEIGRILIKAYPQGVATRCHLGQLPLHRACLNRDASPELCSLLVEEGMKQDIGGSEGRGGAFVRDACGKTPIDFLSDKILHAGNSRGSKDMCCSSGSSPTASILHLWRKFSMLAAAVLPPMHCKNPSTGTVLTLHAAIELGCSLQLIKAAMQIHPNEITARDCLGRSCLAVAASKQNTSQDVIIMLIDASASLGSTDVHCIADRDGNLPLHHAAASGRAYDSAMRAILASNPSALMTRDRNGYFPVMSAAIDDNSDIDVVYNLLKESPTVVSLQ